MLALLFCLAIKLFGLDSFRYYETKYLNMRFMVSLEFLDLIWDTFAPVADRSVLRFYLAGRFRE